MLLVLIIALVAAPPMAAKVAWAIGMALAGLAFAIQRHRQRLRPGDDRRPDEGA